MTTSQKKKKIKSLIEKYKKALHLDVWTIDFIVHNEPLDDRGGVANANVDATYMYACVNVYQTAFKGFNDINEIVLHELCHCITDPLYLVGNDLLNGTLRTKKELLHQREKLTEWITKLVLD